MDYFDEFGEKLVSAGRYAGDKVKEVADVARHNAQLVQEEHRFRKACYELGKFYYENSDADTAALQPYIAAVREKSAVIEELKKQIEEMKNK